MLKNNNHKFIIGIDVGLRNLGIVLLNKNYCLCEKLDLIDLNTHNTNEAIINLYNKLNEFLLDINKEEIEIVGIEQQPEQQHVARFKKFPGAGRDNTQMKSISHALQMYFLCNKIQVTFISAKSKWQVYEGEILDLKTKSKDKYTINKKKSIIQSFWLMKNFKDHEGLKFINNLIKKDDVCDAYLISCYLLKKNCNSLNEFNFK